MSIEFGEDKIPFINLGSGYVIRLEYEDMKDEKYLEKARNELRESPENIENAIAELRKLIKGKARTYQQLKFKTTKGQIFGFGSLLDRRALFL